MNSNAGWALPAFSGGRASAGSDRLTRQSVIIPASLTSNRIVEFGDFIEVLKNWSIQFQNFHQGLLGPATLLQS